MKAILLVNDILMLAFCNLESESYYYFTDVYGNLIDGRIQNFRILCDDEINRFVFK